jgi:acetyl esterase
MLDPQIATLLEQQADAPDICDLPLAEARERMRGLQELGGEPDAVGDLREIEIASPAGPLEATVYRPAVPPEGGSPPALLYLHGGGWVGGSRQAIDGTARRLANAARCLVVSADYRLAPEHPFPAAVEDAHCWLRWTAGSAADLGADPARLAVGGASAGATLALSAALKARDEGDRLPDFLLLHYPIADRSLDQESCRTLATGYVLTTRSMEWFWNHYLADHPDDAAHPYASPLRADLAGLPPTHVLTAGYDPMKDQQRALVERMRAAGVPVEHLEATGLVHGFLGMSSVLDAADDYLVASAGALREAIGLDR